MTWKFLTYTEINSHNAFKKQQANIIEIQLMQDLPLQNPVIHNQKVLSFKVKPFNFSP